MSAFSRLFRRGRWAGLLCLLVLPTAVYVQTARQPKVYASQIVVEGNREGTLRTVGYATIFNTGSAELAAGYVGTPRIAQETARVLGDRYQLGQISASVDRTTGWLRLTATSTDRESAVATAKAALIAVQETLTATASDQVRGAIASAVRGLRVIQDPARRQEVRQALAELRRLRSAPADRLRLVEQAATPRVIAPHPVRNTALAVVLALLIAPAVVLVAARFDPTVRGTDELERLLGAPVLCHFATGGGEARQRQTAILRDRLAHSNGGVPLTSLLIVSPLPDDKSPSPAHGLASAFARTGRRVVLVDIGASGAMPEDRSASGFTALILGADLDATLEVAPKHDGVTILPPGSPVSDQAALLGSPRARSVLETLSGRFDLVVIDAPPLLTAPIGLPLLRQVSGVLAVARLNATPRDALDRMKRIVGAAGGRMLGAVATGGRSAMLDDLGVPIVRKPSLRRMFG